MDERPKPQNWLEACEALAYALIDLEPFEDVVGYDVAHAAHEITPNLVNLMRPPNSGAVELRAVVPAFAEWWRNNPDAKPDNS